MAAEHAAFKERTELVPDLPEPLASKPHDGMQRGREIAARYCENLALRAAAIAFGEGTKSLHTRVQCMQLLWNMVQEVPEPVPTPPENGCDQAING